MENLLELNGFARATHRFAPFGFGTEAQVLFFAYLQLAAAVVLLVLSFFLSCRIYAKKEL